MIHEEDYDAPFVGALLVAAFASAVIWGLLYGAYLAFTH